MSTSLNRRSFGVQLLAGAGVPLAASIAVEGALLEKAESQAEDKTSPVESLSRTDLIMEWVKRQYPDPRLDAKALEEIRGDVDHQLGRSEILSRFPLANSDAPAIVFAPFRSESPQRQEP